MSEASFERTTRCRRKFLIGLNVVVQICFGTIGNRLKCKILRMLLRCLDHCPLRVQEV